MIDRDRDIPCGWDRGQEIGERIGGKREDARRSRSAHVDRGCAPGNASLIGRRKRDQAGYFDLHPHTGLLACFYACISGKEDLRDARFEDGGAQTEEFSLSSTR